MHWYLGCAEHLICCEPTQSETVLVIVFVCTAGAGAGVDAAGFEQAEILAVQV